MTEYKRNVESKICKKDKKIESMKQPSAADRFQIETF